MLFIFAPLYLLVYPRVNQNAPRLHLWGIDKLQVHEAVELKMTSLSDWFKCLPKACSSNTLFLLWFLLL